MSPTYQHFYIWRAQKFDLKKSLITSLILWCYGFVSNMGIDEDKEQILSINLNIVIEIEGAKNQSF